MEKKTFLTALDVAGLLDVSLPTVRRMKARGVLVPVFIPGTRIARYLRKDVLRILRRPERGKPALRVIRN